ncbi:MAG: MoxR family ATPase [Clostridia bacterium]|nr:MoxR family ATPase [Clostridia bacterium]
MSELITLPVKIVDNIEKVIIGKREAIELVVTALIADGHILIEDVPGIGKTSMVSALAKSLGLKFKRIQFTPDILPSDITGFSMYNMKTGEFEYREGNIMSNLILADEINRTSPKTQASMLEVMEERQVTVDAVTYPIPNPFMVLATQNPVEYLGTYPLPEAQLDRFLMKISIGYPTLNMEKKILEIYRESDPMDDLEQVADANMIIEMRKAVRKITVNDKISNYIVRVVSSTRGHEQVKLGCSPRAALFLMKASQARAFMEGRTFVTPDDAKQLAVPVLAHRLVLNQAARLKGIPNSEIINEILDDTPIQIK